jgi:small multidrug resistance pump
MFYTYLVIAFVLNACANVLLKTGASLPVTVMNPLKAPLLWLEEHRFFFVGAFFFVVNIFFYYAALKQIPLTVAYPVMLVGSILLVNAYAILVFKEQLTMPQVLGYAFLILGIGLIFTFADKHG